MRVGGFEVGGEMCVGGGALQVARRAIFSISLSFSLFLSQNRVRAEEGSTQLGFPYPLTQVMVLHTGDCMEAKCWGCM